jgi:hypothetical protein
MRLIILFPTFIHPIIPYYYLQLILIILLLHPIHTLILLLRPHNNGLSSMEMFKLVMVDFAILLPMKMSQFICVIVKKDFHDHVWTKPFLKELFEGLSIMVAIIHHSQIALLKLLWHHLLVKIIFDELGLV